MRRATLVLSVVFALGLLFAVPDYAEDPGQETSVPEATNEAPQCVEPQVESPLPAVMLPGIEQPTASIRACTAEEASTCPTGCGCLVVGSGPCCIGLAAHCALTCS